MSHANRVRAGISGFTGIAGAALGLASPANAATVTWTNPLTGNYNDATNWDLGTVPSSAANDKAIINNGGTAIINADQTVGSITLGVGSSAGQSGNIQMTGGSLTNYNSDLRIGGDSLTGSGSGTFTQSAGAITWNFGNLNVGQGSNGASGTFTRNGGSFQLNSTSAIAAIGNRGTGVLTQTAGTFYLKSGANTLTGLLNIGRNAANGTAAGTVNLSGGTMAVAQIRYGNGSNSAGSINAFNLSGTGVLIADSITVFANHAGADAFNFTGGALTANTIGLPLTNTGGTLSPGSHNFASNPADITAVAVAPIGTVVFSGTGNGYTQGPAGKLAIDLADAATFDRVDIGIGTNVASAVLAGTIAVSTLSGFDPALGSTFDVLTADTVTSTAVATGLTPGGNAFAASVIPAGGVDGRDVLRLTVVPAPEPGTITLLGLARASLALRRRRPAPKSQ